MVFPDSAYRGKLSPQPFLVDLAEAVRRLAVAALRRLAVQLDGGIGVAAAFLWAFPTALVMFKIIDLCIGVRVASVDEQRGLDFSEHEEVGYPEFQEDQLHRGKEEEAA